MKIDVSDIPKARLLQELYANAATPGFWGAIERVPMTDQTAEELTQEDRQYFDYLHGRVLKVEINGRVLNSALYDRDNGNGSALRCVDTIRKEMANATA